MITHWPWWAGGLGLAAIAITHWLLTRRTLAVSGRISALVDRLRHGAPSEPELSEAQMLEALMAATAKLQADLQSGAFPAVAAEAPTTGRLGKRGVEHLVFLLSLVAGGALSMALAGGATPVLALRGQGLASFGALGPVALVVGGVLVGFGTRMAGGCTSGHGLCGVSRLQRGSLLATAAFFGAGVLVSLAIGALV